MTDESITERIQQDMTAAMKARDAGTLSTLRMLKAALMEVRTKKAKDAAFSRDEEIEVLQRYAKKRRETIEELRRIGREDLVAYFFPIDIELVKAMGGRVRTGGCDFFRGGESLAQVVGRRVTHRGCFLFGLYPTRFPVAAVEQGTLPERRFAPCRFHAGGVPGFHPPEVARP